MEAKEFSPIDVTTETYSNKAHTPNTCTERKDKTPVLDCGVCTPINASISLSVGEGSKSKNMESCYELLKYADMIHSDDDAPVYEELRTLPSVGVKALSLGNFKRSLLGPMEQVVDAKNKAVKNPKWELVLTRKLVTRNHGNVT